MDRYPTRLVNHFYMVGGPSDKHATGRLSSCPSAWILGEVLDFGPGVMILAYVFRNWSGCPDIRSGIQVCHLCQIRSGHTDLCFNCHIKS